MIAFDPAIHHRRSIRRKGHDYAGGGVYFVTICAHRDAGDIFADPDVREMVGRVWRDLPRSAVGACIMDAPSPAVGASLVDALFQGTHEGCGQKKGTHEGCPYVVMPDHFHAVVRMRAGEKTLGDVVGAFKSLVVHEYIAGVKAGRFAPFPGRIWHRNYYERIVGTAEAERRINEYIRANPWKLVQEGIHDGRSYRMIGNPALFDRAKIAILCSRNCPPAILERAKERARAAGSQSCFIGGFHSPPEREILAALLRGEARVICCPAWSLDAMKIPADWIAALEANRMLVLEMLNCDADLAAAEARNRFALDCAQQSWIPHMSPGGMLERLVEEVRKKQNHKQEGVK